MIHILHYLLPVWHLLTSLSFQSLIVAACATELPWVPCHSAPPDLHVHLRTTCSETFKNCKYKSPLSLAHTRKYTQAVRVSGMGFLFPVSAYLVEICSTFCCVHQIHVIQSDSGQLSCYQITNNT